MECSLTINHNQNRALLGRGRGAPSCLPLIQTSLGRKRGRGWACLPWVTLQGTSSGRLSLGLDVPAPAVRRVEVILFNPRSLSNSKTPALRQSH